MVSKLQKFKQQDSVAFYAKASESERCTTEGALAFIGRVPFRTREGRREGHYRVTAAYQLKTTVNGDGVLWPAGAARRNRSPSLVTAQSAAAPGTWNRTL